jgi:short-subunit dehydrogenase
MKDLSQKTALITGASRGIGAYIAQALADEGMKLILVAREKRGLQQVAESLEQRGAWVHVLPSDLSHRDALEPLVSRAVSLTGAIDVLVNNAAVACFLPFHRYQPLDLEHELFLNLTAPLLLTRFVLPHMIAKGSGHIINISSLAGEFPIAYLASYSAAKSGMASFCRSLRQELSGTGVSASAVLPGVVRDEGMIHNFERMSGYSASRSAGGCSAKDVAQAVILAIRNDLPDIVVDRRGTRWLLALLRLTPRAMERYLGHLGIQESSKHAVAMNLKAGGSLTGVAVSPEGTRPAEDDNKPTLR